MPDIHVGARYTSFHRLLPFFATISQLTMAFRRRLGKRCDDGAEVNEIARASLLYGEASLIKVALISADRIKRALSKGNVEEADRAADQLRGAFVLRAEINQLLLKGTG